MQSLNFTHILPAALIIVSFFGLCFQTPTDSLPLSPDTLKLPLRP